MLLNVAHSRFTSKPYAININACSSDTASGEERSSKRRPLLLGIRALALSLLPVNSVLAEGIMEEITELRKRADEFLCMFNKVQNESKDRFKEIEESRLKLAQLQTTLER
ncbi:uncharacterized protein LOC141693345 isoform X2 [Apium graveolens]|uniref:uncharacterized protein LOC141693345 isoform X2 n=1 Tax=Apium graveolens TaxID=4045 RepID=UPI003D7BD48B